MDIATFNVNSLKVRLEALVQWTEEAKPDIVCLQELKLAEEAFPREEIERRGWHLAVVGQRTWNGVAVLSRTPVEVLSRALPGLADDAARFLRVRTHGVDVACVYVPNGAEVGSEKFAYKLRWLDALLADVRSWDPERPALLTGDFNIAPDDRDVWDPALFEGQLLCTSEERERFFALLDLGFVDALRRLHPEPRVFTWWDYRLAAFRRGMGIRLDHLLANRALAARLQDVRVERHVRGWPSPSDHAPVVGTFEG
jgi:exodeoxyribonuclease III